MPVEGPFARAVKRTVQNTAQNVVQNQVEARVTKAATSGAHKVLSGALGDKIASGLVDDEAIGAGVHALLEQALDVASQSVFETGWRGAPALDDASIRALTDAGKSFVQPNLTAAERRQKLAHAAGDPLTDAVLGVIVDIAQLVPAGAVQKGATLLGKTMGDAGVKEAASAKWYSAYVPTASSIEQLGPSIEKVRARLQEPGFRTELSRALDSVRVLGRLEASNLEKIAIDVDKTGEPAVKQALARYVTSVSEAASTTLIPRDSSAGVLARDLVALAGLQMRASTNAALPEDAAAFQAIIKRLGGAGVVDGVMDAASALRENEVSARSLAQHVNQAGDVLLAELEKAGAVSGEARAGVRELCADISAVTVTGAHLFRLYGAIKNAHMPDAERVALIKSAAKDAGPVIVKLLQTFANQSELEGTIDAVAHRALLELQDRAPEMSDAEVRAQVEAGLGMKLEEAFVSFDMKAIASASIGQTHKARIKPRFGKERDVAVKVQRPNLDEEFARATRVARLGLQFASELVKVMGEQGKLPFDLEDKKLDPNKIMKMIEETVGQFVSSFQIETDFDKERVNLKHFRRDMSTHNHVTAPYVFRRWSSKTVMTMEFMRFEKVTSLIERATLARATKKIQAPVGPLDAKDPRADVTHRAVDHIARAFGITVKPEDVSLERVSSRSTQDPSRSTQDSSERGDAWVASVPSEHALYPLIKLSVSDIGVIKHVLAPPVLKDSEVRLVRDRFLGSLLSQALVHGRVHGDPHKGNWGLLADGQTIVMLDFGKVIDLEKKHLMAPISLAWNWFRQDPSGMADAAITMATPTTKERRAEAKLVLVKALDELREKGGTRAEPDQIIAAVTGALAESGLGLSPVYTQSIKAGFSYAGNFTGLAEVGAGDLGIGSIARATSIAAGDALDTATLGIVGGVLALRKNARVNALNQPPQR